MEKNDSLPEKYKEQLATELVEFVKSGSKDKISKLINSMVDDSQEEINFKSEVLMSASKKCLTDEHCRLLMYSDLTSNQCHEAIGDAHKALEKKLEKSIATLNSVNALGPNKLEEILNMPDDELRAYLSNLAITNKDLDNQSSNNEEPEKKEAFESFKEAINKSQYPKSKNQQNRTENQKQGNERKKSPTPNPHYSLLDLKLKIIFSNF